MDVREKLVELIAKAKAMYAEDYTDHTEDEYIAETLLDNGVTVQGVPDNNVVKWISVKDRLPDKNREAVLIALRWEETDIGWYDKDDKCWQSEFINSYDDGDVTHWMPLPQPPKGE